MMGDELGTLLHTLTPNKHNNNVGNATMHHGSRSRKQALAADKAGCELACAA